MRISIKEIEIIKMKPEGIKRFKQVVGTISKLEHKRGLSNPKAREKKKNEEKVDEVSEICETSLNESNVHNGSGRGKSERKERKKIYIRRNNG